MTDYKSGNIIPKFSVEYDVLYKFPNVYTSSYSQIVSALLSVHQRIITNGMYLSTVLMMNCMSILTN